MELTCNSLGTSCLECKGSLIHDRGDQVCTVCGLVQNEGNYQNLESTYYDEEQKNDRKRTGLPISIMTPDINSNIMISKHDLNDLPYKVRPHFKRIIKWNYRFTIEKKNLQFAKTEIKKLCSKLQAHKNIEELTMALYRKCHDLQIIRGRSINGVVAGCFYYASHKYQFPLCIDEIESVSTESRKTIRKCFCEIVRALNLKYSPLPPSNTLNKYASEFELDSQTKKMLSSLFNKYRKAYGISGKSTKGICAGLFYYLKDYFQPELTQKDLSERFNITEVTLRSRYKEIEKITFRYIVM